ncbi:MAG: zinc finger CCCH domain-containing protein [archaeon]|nr:zinc finger CCCH domain-containing protein [archaeon]
MGSTAFGVPTSEWSVDLDMLFGLDTEINLGVEFDFEKDLVQSNVAGGFIPAQYEKGAEICAFFPRGTCLRGTRCPYRHPSQIKNDVCKHWINGRCKKGPECEFLHQYDMSKMPECQFYGKPDSECSNPECNFRHIVDQAASKPCAWFARGFCKHGPKCRAKHVKKTACANYLAGFCPDGPNCQFGHPKYEIIKQDDKPVEGSSSSDQQQRKARQFSNMTCFHCQQPGHSARECPLKHDRDSPFSPHRPDSRDPNRPYRDLSSVTCHKCQQTGHYADKCPLRRPFRS